MSVESKLFFQIKKYIFSCRKEAWIEEWDKTNEQTLKITAFFSERFLFWSFLLEHDMEISWYWRPSPEQREKLCGLSFGRISCWDNPLLCASSPLHWHSSWAGTLRRSQPWVSVARGGGRMVTSAANDRIHGGMVEWFKGQDGGRVFCLRVFFLPIPFCLFAFFQLWEWQFYP